MKIGTDIIQIDRVEKLITKFGNKFALRYLSDEELSLAKSTNTLAGFWSAKEAISKALGCGIGAELAFHDIILSKTAKGAPKFILSPSAQKRFNIKSSSLSISHDGGFAIAVVAIDCH
jgi:holo-[acyl-carrier protein] synthase